MGPHAAHLVMAIHAPVFRDSEEPTVNTVSEHDKIYALTEQTFPTLLSSSEQPLR